MSPRAEASQLVEPRPVACREVADSPAQGGPVVRDIVEPHAASRRPAGLRREGPATQAAQALLPIADTGSTRRSDRGSGAVTDGGFHLLLVSKSRPRAVGL